MNIFSIIIIALSLSLDSFSLSLSLGIYNNQKKILLFPIIVGIMHFLFPILGSKLGNVINDIFIINTDKLLIIILIFILIGMLLDLFDKKSINIKTNIFNMLLLALSVSIDSFSAGIGLINTYYSIYIISLIFSLFATIFTYLGLLLGKLSFAQLGNKAKIFAVILLIILLIRHIFF